MKTETSNVKLNVLEERVCNMIKTNNSDHAEILKKIEEIDEKLDRNFVPLNRYLPIEKIVYGLVTVILIAVIGGIVRLVIR